MMVRSALFCVALTLLLTLSGLQANYYYRKHVEYKSDLHIIDSAVNLNSVTFEKVVSQVEVVAVLFAPYLSHGKQHREFKEFAESAVTQPRVLAATIGVIETDYKDNWDVAARYNISTEFLPQLLLFVNGTLRARFEGEEWNCDTYRGFVAKHTGLWMGRKGTVEYLDRLTSKFIRSNNVSEQERLLDQAIKYTENNITDVEAHNAGHYYIRVMNDYLSRGGVSFLGFESGRLKKLSSLHKFHHEHLCSLKKEMNILQSFYFKAEHLEHDVPE